MTQRTATEIVTKQQEAADRINGLIKLKVDSDAVRALLLMNEILMHPRSPN